MKGYVFLVFILSLGFQTKAQTLNCNFKKPVITIHFGAGDISDLNKSEPLYYERVGGNCPTDGHYTYSSFTEDCFRGDWFTLAEDHTTGDASGNMMIVNSAYNTGVFFQASVNNLKAGTTYQFGVWLMNVCRITDKCPFPLLPNLSVRLVTSSGKIIAQASLGEITRQQQPKWTLYRFVFKMPSLETGFNIVMVNNKPGGCGNDFAMDDITIRECIITPPPAVVAAPKKTITNTEQKVSKEQKAPVKQAPKKTTPVAVKQPPKEVKLVKTQKDSVVYSPPAIKPKPRSFPPPPPVLTRRLTDLAKRIETEAGEININLYDNGEIDGDTVSIYHNNVLVMSHARLSAKPITVKIAIDSTAPHHELVMVAENLGSIPPNTSVMVITAGSKRYEVFISSSEQKNAKVIFNLKQ